MDRQPWSKKYLLTKTIKFCVMEVQTITINIRATITDQEIF